MMRRVSFLVGGLAAVGLLLIAACSGSAPETVEFNLDIRDRALDQESTVFRVKNGDTVVLLITSDEAGTLHLHGYDLEDELGEEGVTRIEFVADLEGRFAMAMHPSSVGGHSHDETDLSGCPDVVPLPEGAEPPTIQVNAEPGSDVGEIEVGVVLENFELTLTDTEREVAEGHWHLYVDGELRGMYLVPEAKVLVESAGEHDIMVRLSDTEHCYYSTVAMTTVTLTGESGDGEMSMDDDVMDGEMDHDSMDDSGGEGTESAPEETVIGFLEVLPR